jgi:hypothetical protein
MLQKINASILLYYIEIQMQLLEELIGFNLWAMTFCKGWSNPSKKELNN